MPWPPSLLTIQFREGNLKLTEPSASLTCPSTAVTIPFTELVPATYQRTIDAAVPSHPSLTPGHPPLFQVGRRAATRSKRGPEPPPPSAVLLILPRHPAWGSPHAASPAAGRGQEQLCWRSTP